MPRAAINISEGTWGGHLIEGCDVFETVLETGDHGSFNAWGRDRYWGLEQVPAGALAKLALLDAVEPVVLRNNRWRCDHGWDVDLDDGSSHYLIYNNLLLNGGLKFREGFHRTATNNVIVGNSFHPHAWYANCGDVFARNIIMGPYQPAVMNVAKWGAELDHNLFTTSDADRLRFAAKGCDAHSLVGDAQFIDAAKGDFRVKPGSPALKLGFVNFPMDHYGVRSPRLRAIAKTPEIPAVVTASNPQPEAVQTLWLGATLRGLKGQEYSALGVASDASGVFFAEVPPESVAFKMGLRAGDFVQQADGVPVRRVEEFLAATQGTNSPHKTKLQLIRNSHPMNIEVNAPPK